MPTPPTYCPHCRAPIPADAPGGLCPACVLLGVAGPTNPSQAAAAAVPTLEEVAAAFPDLEILELIGQGGMGVVFKARQPRLDRFVALKILPPALAAQPGFAERFTREARALARLSHPHIVAIYDFGESAGFYYLVMEYVDGVNLRVAMRAGVKPEQALLLVPRVCEALQFAHDHGVLHRDIKPENILLDARGTPKLADFGIAKLAGEEAARTGLTMSGSTLGTLAYMAPEQVEKPASVDHRADIYSLGVVLYEMLTGELPLGRFAVPSEKSAVHRGVDEVVMRALEKERERRQQSATEMKTEVNAAATGSGPAPTPPRSAPPPPPSPSLSSRARDFQRKFSPKTHVPIVAALQIGFGVFHLITSLLALPLVFKVFDFTMQTRHHFTSVDTIPFSFGGAFVLFLILSMLFVSLPGIIGGWGLFYGRKWARLVVLVVGFLQLFQFPIGTLLAIYTLIVLLRDPEPPELPTPAASAK